MTSSRLQTDVKQKDSQSTSSVQQSLDDRATTSYVRRTLCAHHAISSGPPKSIHELLPPLTSSNDLDLELYAIIAIILKEFVQSWYNRITPDHVFIDEILRIIAHCTRTLEERIRNADLEKLLLDQIPSLIESHITAYRISQNPHSLVSNSSHHIYHSLHPHPALEPVPGLDEDLASQQKAHELAWRQMIAEGMLAVLLPTEDLQNSSIRALVSQIVAEMVIGNVLAGRMCESWVLWEIIANTLDASSKPKSNTRKPSEARDKDRKKKHSGVQLQKLGLVSDAGAEDGADNIKTAGIQQRIFLLTQIFWMSLNHGILAFSLLKSLVLLFISSASLLPRTTQINKDDITEGAARSGDDVQSNCTGIQPILAMPVWSLVSQMVEFKDRMPWLAGIFELIQMTSTRPSNIAGSNGRIDRLLASTIHKTILNPVQLPLLLRTLRRSLFPANTFPRGPRSTVTTATATITTTATSTSAVKATVAPSTAEQHAVRRRAAAALLHRVPSPVRAVYFATGSADKQVAAVEQWLDVLADAYCNRHLMFALLELVLAVLMPELKANTVTELMEIRLGQSYGGGDDDDDDDDSGRRR